MMKKKAGWKRRMLLVLTAVFFVLAGCGGKENGTAATAGAQAKDYVYRVEPVAMELKEDEYISRIIKSQDGTLYAYGYGYSYSEDGVDHSWVTIWKMTEENAMEELCTIQLDSNTSLNSFTVDDDGSFYMIRNIYSYDEPDENGNYKDDYYLVKMTGTGEEVFSILLNTLPEVAAMNTEGYFYTGGDMLLQNESLYVSILGRYVEFDKEGNFRRILSGASEEALASSTLYAMSDGSIIASSYEENGIYVAGLDLETGALGEKYKLPGMSYEYSIYPGIGYDLLLTNNYGVYGYHMGDEELTQLMNYIDSDLGMNNVYNIVPVSETEFWGSYDDFDTGETLLGKFIKVDPADVKDKEVLTLACAGMNWDVRRAVVKFNKSNEQYRITIQDYSSLYNTEEDYSAGVTRLNADIVSGKVPDILILNDNMPVESYESKGLFEDLKPFVEADEELELSDFMPNIIEAFSMNGKWYQLVPSYSVNTVLVKKSDAAGLDGWTIQEAREALAAKPEGTQLFSMITRDTVLMNSMSMAGNQYIDWESGTCSFDSEGFLQLLEFANEFPEEYGEADYDDEYWNSYDTMWRDGRVMAQVYTLTSFTDFNYVEKGSFGEDVSIIGFPSANRDGSAIVADLQIAMSAKSANKDGVWAFMRTFLSDEYQSEVYGLPLSISRMEEMAAEARKQPSYIDENGNEVTYTNTYYVGGVEIEIPPMTEEETEELIQELYQFTNVYSYNEELLNIVQEEVAAYFSGQKSAADVAAIIQSRAKIYVSENS